jgi:subfamily B ATP-binding cassette protein MsbA
MEKSGTKKDLLLYRRLLTYLYPLKMVFLFSILGYLVFSAAQVLAADWMQFVMDTIAGEENLGIGVTSGIMLKFFGDYSATDKGLYFLIASSIVALALIRGVGFFIGNYFLAFVSFTIIHNLRQDVFNKMLVVPSSYYDNSSTGNLIAKVTYHVNQVTGAATNAVKVIIREGFFVIGLLTYIFWLNWQLSLIILAIFPIIGIIVTWVGRQFRRISRKLQNSVGDVTQVANETIGGYKEVRLFGGQEYEAARFGESSAYNRKHSLKMAFYSGTSSPVIQIIISLAMATIVYVALNMRETWTAGQFVAYLIAAGMLAKPIRQLSEVVSIVQKGLAACDDLFTFMDSEQEQDIGSYQIDRVNGEIEFKELDFAYSAGGVNVLEDINIKIESGQTIALVGLSGSGKSTLVSLLARFYNHDKGNIFIDGVDVNDFKLANLRSQIAIVTQQVILFNDSIFNNIAYGQLANASIEDVVKACESANAADFIERLPQGMDTVVGENGVMLSGGQRQRLAIARALLKNAPILILDEATSALDNKAENKIQQALDKVMENRTTLVIAHRLSTIENADKILVMEQGRIIEVGNHHELIDKNGLYASLYEKRFDQV